MDGFEFNLTLEELEMELNDEKTSDNSSVRTTTSLSVFFKNRGFEIVDLRQNGGCLWVVGEKCKLEPVVAEAYRIFKVTGEYAKGRATNHKPAWWTKSQK